TMHHITSFILSFFFSSRRRHTRSKRDWSSDVCSSDLIDHLFGIVARSACVPQRQWRHSVGVHVLGGALQLRERCDRDPRVLGLRSEERRVGKECRSRGEPEHEEEKVGYIRVVDGGKGG